LDGKFNSTTWEKLENKNTIENFSIHELSQAQKKPRQQDFQTTWMKTSLVLNSGHGIKKSKVKAKNDVCTMWMQKDFITKMWQK